jgi:hypothetical protein
MNGRLAVQQSGYHKRFQMGLLEKVYDALVHGTNLMSLNLPHRDTLYIKALLESKFNKEFTAKEVQDLLTSVGLEFRK